MSPYDFMMEYRAMDVRLIDGTVLYGIDVHEYRNAKDYYTNTDSISDDHDVDAGMGAFKKLKNAILKNGKKLGSKIYRCTFPLQSSGSGQGMSHTEDVALNKLEGCYAGKGSPEMTQTALRLAQAYGFIQPTATSMNQYVTKYMGIDCSGFVTNYLRQRGRDDMDPGQINSVAYRTLGTRITSLDKVRGGDIMAWTDTNHVGVIDTEDFEVNHDEKKGVPPIVCDFVESTGADATKGDKHSDGLMCTTYSILSVGKNHVFQVSRADGWEQAGLAWDKAQGHQRKQWNVLINRIE